MQEQTCRVPVEATYRMIDGQPVMIDAVWADIPARLIVDMIVQHLGGRGAANMEKDES